MYLVVHWYTEHIAFQQQRGDLYSRSGSRSIYVHFDIFPCCDSWMAMGPRTPQSRVRRGLVFGFKKIKETSVGFKSIKIKWTNCSRRI